MENKNSCSSTLKVGSSSASIRLQKRNTLRRDHHQVSLLEEAHNIRLLLCDEEEKCCEEGAGIRLDIIMAHSLCPRFFNKHQQKILKEVLEKRKESLYVK